MLLQGKWDHKTSNSYFYFQTQHIQNMHTDRFACFFWKEIQFLPKHLAEQDISLKFLQILLWGIFALSACIQSYWQTCPSRCIVKWNHFRAVSPRLCLWLHGPSDLPDCQSGWQESNPTGMETGKMRITVTTGPMHDCHGCQSSWAASASSSGEEEVSERHGSVLMQQGAVGAPREGQQHRGHQSQPRASGKSVVKRRAPGQIGKSIHWSGSDPVRKPGVRWNLLINRGVHRDKTNLGYQLSELQTHSMVSLELMIK